jgi:G3E family GTPase
LNFDKNKSEMYEIFANQIISADKILLNKIDKINFDKSEIHRIRDFIYSVNPLAKITETQYSSVSTDYFLEESALNTNIDFQDLSSKQKHLDEEKQVDITKSNNTHDHEHFHEKQQIENLIIYTNLKNKSELDQAIGNIIWDLAEDNNFSIIRFKGIFYSEEGTFSIQGLYDLYEINEIHSNIKVDGLDEKKSKILFIGKGIRENKEIIEKKLIK